jgi:uncharacterized protein YcsI (UPF0317 family)
MEVADSGAPSARPEAVREAIRNGRWRKPTAGLCPGFTQVNVVSDEELSEG